MSETQSNNKRIAKNSFFLYVRMVIITVVNLFTVRITLDILGIVDYGIYNVVAGVVAMLTVFTVTMTSASQRFFAYELGRKNIYRLNKYFNLTLLCYICLVIVLIGVAESVGLWFIANKINVPAERMNAVFWIYQFSILSFVLNILYVPFLSMIIAYEYMKFYALVSTVEAVLKLILVVFLRFVTGFDVLILYGLIMLLLVFFMFLSYYFCCLVRYAEATKLHVFWNKKMFLQIFSYTGWSLFGTTSDVLRNQGVNILLNVFFNPVINAARAISIQVNTALNLFVASYFQAVRPQVTKYFAEKSYDKMLTLTFQSSRFCYFLLLICAIPLLCEINYILSLWLTSIPDFTVLFTKLIIILVLLESIGIPLMTAINSTGKIKWYQICSGSVLLLNLPLSYLFLKMYHLPELTYYVNIVLSVIVVFLKLYFLRKRVSFKLSLYFKETILPIVMITLLSFTIVTWIQSFFSESIFRLLLVLFTSTFVIGGLVYIIGLSREERLWLNNLISSKLLRR